MVQRQHLWALTRGGSVHLAIQHTQTSMCSCRRNCQKYLDLEHFGLTQTKTNGEQSEMENHTILCQYRYGTAHLRSGKINKYLSGSYREHSIGEGMAVPELRTRFFQKTGEKRA